MKAWLVHSAGGERATLDGTLSWKALGGDTVILLDYAGDLERKAITAIVLRCNKLGMACIPGALLAGGDLAPAQRSLPAVWRRHTTEAAWWAKYRGTKFYALDTEQWCGMNFSEDLSDDDASRIILSIAWLAAELAEMGVTLLLYGPCVRKYLKPGFARFTARLWSELPPNVVMLDYIGDGTYPTGVSFIQMFIHGDYTGASYMKAAAGMERSVYYCPVDDLAGNITPVVPLLSTQAARTTSGPA